MAKKRSGHSGANVTGLHLWCREVLAGIAGLDRAVAESVAPLQGVNDRALALRDNKALEQLALELRDWVRGLSPEQRASIEGRVRAKLGLGLADAVPTTDTVIGEVLARGAIATEHEFRVIETRVIDEPGSSEEVRTLNKLLEEYVRRLRSNV